MVLKKRLRERERERERDNHMESCDYPFGSCALEVVPLLQACTCNKQKKHKASRETKQIAKKQIKHKANEQNKQRKEKRHANKQTKERDQSKDQTSMLLNKQVRQGVLEYGGHVCHQAMFLKRTWNLMCKEGCEPTRDCR